MQHCCIKKCYTATDGFEGAAHRVRPHLPRRAAGQDRLRRAAAGGAWAAAGGAARCVDRVPRAGAHRHGPRHAAGAASGGGGALDRGGRVRALRPRAAVARRTRRRRAAEAVGAARIPHRAGPRLPRRDGRRHADRQRRFGCALRRALVGVHRRDARAVDRLRAGSHRRPDAGPARAARILRKVAGIIFIIFGVFSALLAHE